MWHPEGTVVQSSKRESIVFLRELAPVTAVVDGGDELFQYFTPSQILGHQAQLF